MVEIFNQRRWQTLQGMPAVLSGPTDQQPRQPSLTKGRGWCGSPTAVVVASSSKCPELCSHDHSPELHHLIPWVHLQPFPVQPPAESRQLCSAFCLLAGGFGAEAERGYALTYTVATIVSFLLKHN